MKKETISAYLASQFSLSGKRALITGSSRGLGFAFAEALARAGAQVIMNGRNVEKLTAATDRLKSDGLDVFGYPFDITEPLEIDSSLDQIRKEHGVIDILINNAGINMRSPIEDMELETWNTVLNTNLTSAFLVSRRIAKGMIEQRDGRIINICSLMSNSARKTIAPYSAAKAGLKMLTQSMATEWGPHNIRANAIGPGYFKTEMNTPLFSDPDFDGWIRGRTPMARWGLPAELTGAVIYLASDASSFTNGQILYVDGGVLATL